MFPPIVTLTTDFGLSDHYAGTLKGVILSRCPQAAIIDISHQIPAFSILAAAYTIDQAACYFPAGSVHVIVIDPGVGTPRRPLLVEAHDSFFIAPDNGVLSLVLARAERWTARELTKQALWLPAPSTTFHGRDIFAPAAAALAARSVQPAEVGPLVRNLILLPGLNPYEVAANTWEGIVLSVDHFGNIVSNFRANAFAARVSSGFVLQAGREQIRRLQATFGESSDQLPFAYWGSSGCLEIGINQGSAASGLGLGIGDRLTLEILP